MRPYCRMMLEEETCARCGKVFLPQDKEVWVYKAELGRTRKKTYYCSYHCWREATEAREIARTRSRKNARLSEADVDCLHTMLKSGVKRGDCAKYFQVQWTTIQRYIDTREKFRDIREMLRKEKEGTGT